jgi:hypothetical protein
VVREHVAASRAATVLARARRKSRTAHPRRACARCRGRAKFSRNGCLLVNLQRLLMTSAAILTFGVPAVIVWGGSVLTVNAACNESRNARQR